MNAERLHAILVSLNQVMAKNDIVNKMQDLINALQNVVNKSSPPQQQQLAQSLKTLQLALADTSTEQFSPAWRQILHEIGGEDLFGASLKANVDAIFARNQITPAVALEELQQLQSRLRAFKTALDQCVSAFVLFKIGDEKLMPGDCEIGILIPRAAVSNQLSSFAIELNEMAFILNTFSEVATGKPDKLEIRTISSSDLLVHLQAAAPYAACLAVAVERVVNLYKSLLEIRKLRKELKKQGVPDKATTGIEDHANELMEKGIEEIAADVVKQYYKKAEEPRKNELTTAVKFSLNKLANRIDKGFNIEVRVAPIDEKQEAEAQNKELQTAIATISNATANMQFMKLEGPPILKLTETKEKLKTKE